MRCFLLLLSLFTTLSLVLTIRNLKVTDKVTLDVEIKGKHVGKIEIGVFRKIVPKTVENFVELCKRPYGIGYKGSEFHRIDKNILIEGGLFEEYGQEGVSIYGKYFDRENFKLQHYGAGWVGMINIQQQYLNTGFYITLTKYDLIDLTSVVFGKVLKGMDVLWILNTIKTDMEQHPIKTITISNCTAEIIERPFRVEKTDATE